MRHGPRLGERGAGAIADATPAGEVVHEDLPAAEAPPEAAAPDAPVPAPDPEAEGLRLTSGAVGRFLITSYRYTATNAGSYALLGSYELRQDGTAPRRHFVFQQAKNLPAMLSTARHAPMLNPKSCQPGPIRIPRYAAILSNRATWTASASGEIRIRVASGTLTEVWRLKDAQSQVYELARLEGTDSYSSVYGMAMLADAIDTGGANVSLADLGASSFQGVGYHKPSAQPFGPLSSGFAPQLFTRPAGYVNVYGYQTVSPSIKGMGILYSLLLNYAPASRLIAYYSGGHDFNANRCMDDLGHDHMMHLVVRQGTVVGIMDLEQSYQTNGWPIETVAAYHR